MEVLCAAFRSSTRARCKMSVPSPPDVLDRPLPNLLPWRRCRLLRTRLKPCGEWESGLAESNLVHRWKNSRGESRPRLDPVDQIRFERRAWRSVRAMSIAFQIASPQGQPSETRLIPVIVDSTGLFARSAPSRECGLARRAGAVDAAAVRSVSDSRLMTGPGAQSTPGQRTAHPRTQDLGPAAASTVFRSANHRQVVTKLRASSRSSEFAGTRPQALDSHMFSFRYFMWRPQYLASASASPSFPTTAAFSSGDGLGTHWIRVSNPPPPSVEATPVRGVNLLPVRALGQGRYSMLCCAQDEPS
jgi:hypothetical protein